MSEKEIDEFSGIETTGHEWDGIKELNNPLPRWWLWTFYATILFSIGYMIYYPAIPLINDATMGISGETNRMRVAEELAAANAAKAEYINQIESGALETIRNDPVLLQFATAGGASLYKVHCSQCHGSGAQGAPGYPNLNDDDWLWGGNLEALYLTIKHGVRSETDDDTRFSEMPAFGTDDILDSQQIRAVTEYVLKLSGQDHDARALEQGEELYAENCAACHGDTGTGDHTQGAPNLADTLSLYGIDRVSVGAQIARPRHGVMPAWTPRLTEAELKQLAVYVHGLGGGE